MQDRNPTNPQGIDISAYQGGLDFKDVKAAGIQVVYIKATEGINYTNPLLQNFYQQAKAQGLKVGFYHFYLPGLDANAQANYFYSIIANLSYDCLPVLDVEKSGGIDAGTLSAAVHVCLNEITYLTGHNAMIYTYTSFAQNNLTDNYVNMYPLWIADYNGKGAPGDNPIWDNWVGFQYSDAGNISGITVDMNEFTSDVYLQKEDNMDVNQALTVLVQNGVISSADYWEKALEVVNYLDVLLINMAKKLEAK